MKIAVGNDHAAVDMKFQVVKYLEDKGYEVINVGIDVEERCNYPEYAKKVADLVAAGEADCGILICGTGIGVALAANKVKGIRAATCSEPVSARLAKEHNNANILTFGARIIGAETAFAMLDAYLGAEFLGGRHAERVAMIMDLEKE